MIVTPEDIAVALGRTAPASDSTENRQWTMWIGDALMLVEARLGDIFDLDQAKLAYVVREAVVAHIRHPDEATQVDVSVDDGSVSRRYAKSRGRIEIIDDWWDLLSPVQSNGAFVIDTVGFGSSHLPWCNLSFGASYCSCGVDIAECPIFEVAP